GARGVPGRAPAVGAGESDRAPDDVAARRARRRAGGDRRGGGGARLAGRARVRRGPRGLRAAPGRPPPRRIAVSVPGGGPRRGDLGAHRTVENSLVRRSRRTSCGPPGAAGRAPATGRPLRGRLAHRWAAAVLPVADRTTGHPSPAVFGRADVWFASVDQAACGPWILVRWNLF